MRAANGNNIAMQCLHNYGLLSSLDVLTGLKVFDCSAKQVEGKYNLLELLENCGIRVDNRNIYELAKPPITCSLCTSLGRQHSLVSEHWLLQCSLQDSDWSH